MPDSLDPHGLTQDNHKIPFPFEPLQGKDREFIIDTMSSRKKEALAKKLQDKLKVP